jgi:hypothetical protein
MKKFSIRVFFFLLTAFLFAYPAIVYAEAVKVIWDTDLGCDFDDAGCGAMLHALASQGHVQLIGTMCCTSNPTGAPALEAINTYWGRAGIPVGTLKEEGFLGSYSSGDHYTDAIASNYPNTLKNGSNAPNAVSLYRKILAENDDSSVVIVTTGPLRNIARLIESGPDQNSQLNGRDLIAKKVKLLGVMGGFYGNAQDEQKADGEWNLKQDGGASHTAIENWPTPAVFSGAEVGCCIWTGRKLWNEGSEDNPAREGYRNAPEHCRDSWDQTIALYIATGLKDYFGIETGGYNEVYSSGINAWHSSPDRNHSYLIKLQGMESALTVEIEDLMAMEPDDFKTGLRGQESGCRGLGGKVSLKAADGGITYRLPFLIQARLVIYDMRGIALFRVPVGNGQVSGTVRFCRHVPVHDGLRPGAGSYVCALEFDGRPGACTVVTGGFGN